MLEKYKEKWKLFMYGEERLSAEETRDGLQNLDLEYLRALALRKGVELENGDIKVNGARDLILSNEKEKLIYQIWEKMAENS